MNTTLGSSLKLAAVVCLLCAPRLSAQDNTRVHILRSRPYTLADTTGLIHAPARLDEAKVSGFPRALGTCAQHLRDTAQNIDLLLIASFTSSSVQTSGDTIFTYRTTYGDYAPKTRKVYGLRDGELVRVDCSRDRPVGRVRTRTTPPDQR